MLSPRPPARPPRRTHAVLLASALLAGTPLSGCSDDAPPGPTTFTVAAGGAPRVLPDLGSAWYRIDLGTTTVRAKGCVLFKGTLALDMTDAPGADIPIALPVDPAVPVQWTAEFTVSQPNPNTVTLEGTVVDVSFGSDLAITLTDIDGATLVAFGTLEETALGQIQQALKADAHLQTIMQRFFASHTLGFVSAADEMEATPSLQVPDGPTAAPPSSTIGYFLQGYVDTTTKERLIFTMEGDTHDPSAPTLAIHVKDYASDGNLTETVTLPLDPATIVGSFTTWSTYSDFRAWWKAVHGEAALPSNTPTDSGVALRWTLTAASALSTLTTGTLSRFGITITADDGFAIMVPGTVVSATLGQYRLAR